ncbi:MAG: 2-amino-4-hydroxy-6-hydroxymethyldihydropteridine diphosphokinase [Planctomycetaceae bacterium]|nr:2-amino-4-hydroxy-6-hydroxymethyldihydropteridine diphosphokinase [Planctomycetaceae bacterium]
MIAYIGMGSNVGDRAQTLLRAAGILARASGVHVRRISRFIETKAQGGPPGQPPYLNAAMEIETDLEPLELLDVLNEVETDLGRDRDFEERWGPRTCDLDILMMEDLVMDSPRLTIPHPRMHERLFVLRPLAEIAPGVLHPVLRLTVLDMLADAEVGQ